MLRGGAVCLSVPTLQIEVKPWAVRPHPEGMPTSTLSVRKPRDRTWSHTSRSPQSTSSISLVLYWQTIRTGRPKQTLGERRSQEKGDQNKHRTILPEGNSWLREGKRTLKDWIHILREMWEGIAAIKKNRTSCTEKKKEGKSIKEFLEIKNYGPNKKFNKRAGEASGRNVRTESKVSMSLIWWCMRCLRSEFITTLKYSEDLLSTLCTHTQNFHSLMRSQLGSQFHRWWNWGLGMRNHL